MPTANFPEELLTLRQCQKCYTAESELKKTGKVLLVCGGCKKAVYCTKDCQKKDWTYHKTFCKLNRDFREVVRGEVSDDNSTEFGGHNPREMEHRLRNWIEHNRPDLQDSAVHALKLFEKPENLKTHLLLITLAPAFKPREKNIDPRKAFTIHLLQPAPMDTLLPSHGDHKQAIASLKQKGRDLQAQGHVGLVMMMIMVMDPIKLVHMSPFGVSDLEMYKPYDPHWKEKLTRKASALPNFILPIAEGYEI